MSAFLGVKVSVSTGAGVVLTVVDVAEPVVLVVAVLDTLSVLVAEEVVVVVVLAAAGFLAGVLGFAVCDEAGCALSIKQIKHAGNEVVRNWSRRLCIFFVLRLKTGSIFVQDAIFF